jgi:hypothetical protein
MLLLCSCTYAASTADDSTRVNSVTKRQPRACAVDVELVQLRAHGASVEHDALDVAQDWVFGQRKGHVEEARVQLERAAVLWISDLRGDSGVPTAAWLQAFLLKKRCACA